MNKTETLDDLIRDVRSEAEGWSPDHPLGQLLTRAADALETANMMLAALLEDPSDA